jgi:hypothetical protein
MKLSYEKRKYTIALLPSVEISIYKNVYAISIAFLWWTMNYYIVRGKDEA